MNVKKPLNMNDCTTHEQASSNGTTVHKKSRLVTTPSLVTSTTILDTNFYDDCRNSRELIG